MNKMLTILAAISLLSLGFVADSNAAGPMSQEGFATFETIDLLGIPVNNSAGEILGTINAFVIDPQGRVDFAILWQGVPLEDISAGRYVAVPFSALAITRMESAEVTVFLNMDKETLNSAPSFDRTNDLNNTEWATSIYRYFGQTPSWTEEGAGKAGPATISPEGGYE